MTFNIRRAIALPLRRADRWSRRRDRVAELVRQQHPTLLGVQEALPAQAAFLGAALGEDYRSVGRGRGRDGGDEGCPIFYDVRRLELLEAEQTALSLQPGRAGSRSWGSVFPRVLLAATFRDRVTSGRFLALNTHFDVFSPRARVRSAELVRRRVLDSSDAVVLTGDLNDDRSSPTLGALLAGGALRDAWRVADTRLTPEWGTLANYRPPRAGGRRIDWVAVSSGVHVETASIPGDPVRGGWASDHLPVVADVRVHPPERTA